MKIQINEVWNGGSDGSKELAVIEINTKAPHIAFQAVKNWVNEHRPDLDLCRSIYDHGYAAREISS